MLSGSYHASSSSSAASSSASLGLAHARRSLLFPLIPPHALARLHGACQQALADAEGAKAALAHTLTHTEQYSNTTPTALRERIIVRPSDAVPDEFLCLLERTRKSGTAVKKKPDDLDLGTLSAGLCFP